VVSSYDGQYVSNQIEIRNSFERLPKVIQIISGNI
jgi:hypothetical protein